MRTENTTPSDDLAEEQQRTIKYSTALVEAMDYCMEKDANVIAFGLGVNDPGRIFGTMGNLPEKYGDRIFDCPLSENGLTGFALGAATMGMRPVLTHQRLDFALLSLDQIINNAAKWHYMFAGQHRAPLVIRMVIGRGWGQGPQHSQSLQAIFAHIPGLKVIMPATPYDAKGLLISSIEDDNPVIILEQRWLHQIEGPVPKAAYRVPIGKAKVVKKGTDITLVGISYMVQECFRAAETLEKIGINAEVIDLRSLRPFDGPTLQASVEKTGRLLVADTGHLTCGMSAELVAWVTERLFHKLKSAPKRVASPDLPTPTTHGLTKFYYPRSHNIVEAALEALGGQQNAETDKALQQLIEVENRLPCDVPDLNFSGPF